VESVGSHRFDNRTVCSHIPFSAYGDFMSHDLAITREARSVEGCGLKAIEVERWRLDEPLFLALSWIS
jgi:hypothetical protein